MGKPERVKATFTTWLLGAALVGVALISYLLTPAPVAVEEAEASVDTTAPVLAEYIRARNSKVPAELADLIANEVVSVCADAAVPVDLVVGIIETESLWNPMAVSPAGARGLMQVLKGDKIEVDRAQAHNIKYNLETGIGILAEKQEISDGLSEALQKYSGGKPGYAELVMQNVGRYRLYTLRRTEG